jgi:hypothetical protein
MYFDREKNLLNICSNDGLLRGTKKQNIFSGKRLQFTAEGKVHDSIVSFYTLNCFPFSRMLSCMNNINKDINNEYVLDNNFDGINMRLLYDQYRSENDDKRDECDIILLLKQFSLNTDNLFKYQFTQISSTIPECTGVKLENYVDSCKCAYIFLTHAMCINIVNRLIKNYIYILYHEFHDNNIIDVYSKYINKLYKDRDLETFLNNIHILMSKTCDKFNTSEFMPIDITKIINFNNYITTPIASKIQLDTVRKILHIEEKFIELIELICSIIYTCDRYDFVFGELCKKPYNLTNKTYTLNGFFVFANYIFTLKKSAPVTSTAPAPRASKASTASIAPSAKI